MEKITKLKTSSKKRVGRGYGSGKGGHTIGRGAKGQKIRGKVSLLFEGQKTKKSLIRRLPLQRGKGKFKSLKPRPLAVDITLLNFMKKGQTVTVDSLIDQGIVSSQAKKTGVKILGNGKLEKSLKVEVACSASAAKIIEAAGGSVTLIGKQAGIDQKVKSEKKPASKAKK